MMSYDLFDKALIKTRRDREVFVIVGTADGGMSGASLALMRQMEKYEVK